MAKPSLSDLLSAPSLLKAAAQADAINEARMVGDRSVGALLEASQKLGKPSEELSYRSQSPFAEAAKYAVGAGATTLMLSSPVAGKMLGRGLLYGLARKGIERNDEAFNRDDLSSYDQALQMLPILYAADPGTFMRGIEGVRHLSSITKQRNPLSTENIRQRKNSSLQVMDKDGKVLKTYKNAVRVIDVSEIDPARIVGSPTSAIAKVPVQKGAYQSALAKLAPPEGGGAASSSAIRALIGPSFKDSFNRAEPRPPSLSQRYPMPARGDDPYKMHKAILGNKASLTTTPTHDSVVRTWYDLVTRDAFSVRNQQNIVVDSDKLLSAQKMLARVVQQAEHLRGQGLPRFEDDITPQELKEMLGWASSNYINTYRPISAADQSMRNFRNPFFSINDSGIMENKDLPAPIKQAPEPSDRWIGPRWNPNRKIEAARESRERAYWDEQRASLDDDVPLPWESFFPSTASNPSNHSRRFVTMTGSGKEYDIDEVLTDAGWIDWVTKHTKPISHSEYYSGLNSDEFINKLNENIAKLNKSKVSYVVQKSPSSASKTWMPSITVTYPDGSSSTGYAIFELTPGAVDIPTGLEGLPEHFKVASYFDSRYPGLNAVNTMMGGILNPSETGGGTHFYEALAKTLRETGKGNLRDGGNSKTKHSLAVWEKIKPDKGFSFYHRGERGSVGGGFNSGVPLIPGLLGLMGQKEERDGSSDN